MYVKLLELKSSVEDKVNKVNKVDFVFTFAHEPKTRVLVEIIISKSTSQLEG